MVLLEKPTSRITVGEFLKNGGSLEILPEKMIQNVAERLYEKYPHMIEKRNLEKIITSVIKTIGDQ